MKFEIELNFIEFFFKLNFIRTLKKEITLASSILVLLLH